MKATELADGLKIFTYWISNFVLFVVAVQFLIGISPWFRDPTDEQGWFGARSGVSFHIDHETGCQYLSKTGLTPRLDRSGKQICSTDSQRK